MLQEGFFERYFIGAFYRQYSDFKGATSPRAALFCLLAWLTVTVGLAGVLVGLVGLLGPEVGFGTSIVVGALWIAGSVVPFAALASRVRNAGAEAGKRGDDGETDEGGSRKGDESAPVFLFIDKAFFVVSGLFFLFGILMMTVTLNSGEINMNPRGSGNGEPNPILDRDSIVEEAIFTYQTDASAEEETPAAEAVDSLADLVDRDTVSLSESFDPTINTPAPENPDTLSMEY